MVPENQKKSKNTIIIKKYKKKGGAHHGGSWKVAYADFVTAMMAFFLLMWLLNMAPPETKAALSEYFQHFSIFEKGGKSAVAKTTTSEASMNEMQQAKSDTESDMEKEAEELSEKLKEQIENNLEEFKDRIIVSKENSTVRIEIIDKDGDPIFPLGGTELSDNGRKIIEGITPVIKNLDKKFIIEGHTDNVSFASATNFTNWELSTARASTARIELERDGVRSNKIQMVAGYADTRPLNKDDPGSPKNRRITIVVPSTNTLSDSTKSK